MNNVSNESEPAPNAELLLDLLESMRNINRQFRILFDQDVVFDENWPRQLSLSEKLAKYELGYALVLATGLNDQYCYPHPGAFRGIIYHGVNYNRAPPPQVKQAMIARPGSPIPGPSNRIVPDPGTFIVSPAPNPIESASNPNSIGQY